MTWREDRYWAAAFEAALEAAGEADLVLVPSEFLGEHPRFAPLEYSWGLLPEGRRIAWCCSKDDAHRLAPWVHEGHADRRHCRWANEVFVLCGRFGWARKASWLSVRHWQVWRERVGEYLAGRGDPEREFRAAPGARRGKGPRVLVVGASGMGNIGDDLLSYVLAELLRRNADARVWWSDSDVAAGHLKRFDAVIVGGGGLIYASRDGRNETQNLANYLKFGPMCRMAGIPVAMIGVSDQDHAGGLDSDDATREFARNCVPLFRRSTTRDSSSTELLQRLGLADVLTGPDLLFAWAQRARRATRPSQHQPARLAMAGELLDNVHIAAGLKESASPLARALGGRQVDLLLMSNDDVSHAKRLSSMLTKLGCTVSIVDFRGVPFEPLVNGFSQYQGLITTRFHGLVLAILCDVPVLALDGPQGKKTRLLRAVSGGEAKLLTTDVEIAEGVARLARAVEGDLQVVGRPRAETFAARTSVHVAAIRDLLLPWISAEVQQDDEMRGPDVEPLPPTHEVAQRHRVAGLVRDVGDRDSSVALCWAASTKDTDGYGNLGDSLSAVIVSALSGRRVRHVAFERPETKLVAVGSIAHAIRNGEAVIWGSGVSIRGGILASSVPRTHYDVRAIRGPISARHLRDFGIPVPDVYGDPVWFLPSIFDEPVEKRYELGVIPHIQDVQGFGPAALPPADSLRFQIDPSDAGSVLLINTWHEPTWEGIRKTLRAILSCKRIVSQSFHGVVIAEAYGIPVLNYRQMVNVPNGPLTISLQEDCTTDPRIWEFYRGGPRSNFEMYSQRREEKADWDAVIRAIDQRWEPFRYDASALAESFPLPLAYDPLASRMPDAGRLKGMRF
jgi:polysaccharide pyruvyl transferase WcaK-like protein